MSFQNITITNYNIFSRSVQSPGVTITTGLNHHRIITLVKGTILQEKRTRLTKVWTQLTDAEQELLYRKYVLDQTTEGPYFNGGSKDTGVPPSKPPAYPTHRLPKFNVKL